MIEMPDVLRGLVPGVGSVWEWEPMKPHANTRVLVTAVRWNGEEVWIETMSDGVRAWNDLSRWVEAAVLVTPAPPE